MGKSKLKSKLKSVYKKISDKTFWIEFIEGGDFVKENYLSIACVVDEKTCICIELAEREDGTIEATLYEGDYRGPEMVEGTIKRI